MGAILFLTYEKTRKSSWFFLSECWGFFVMLPIGKQKKYFLNCNYNSLMNSRQTIFEYHVNTLRNFCKKYKISSKTAIRRYGKKYGKQFIRKEIFEQATLAHGLNADEVVNFLAQWYSKSEILAGKWQKKDGKIIFIPQQMYEANYQEE